MRNLMALLLAGTVLMSGGGGRKLRAIVIHQGVSPDREQTVTVETGGAERTMNLEDYLTGVLLGEMPPEFPMEALKAQAVAARTYTLRRLAAGEGLSDDPAVCQAYRDPAGADPAAADKLRQAVRDTAGEALYYEGELITATYFSCSGGRTEAAEAVWGGDVPYLQSVPSPGEEDAAAYESRVTVDRDTFLETLEVSSEAVTDLQRTEGGGVATVTIGGRTFTGRELREAFSLNSTRFTLEPDAARSTVTFSVQGSGHRVGLSQYGAKAMAEAGSTYREILQWYYPGTEVES